MLNSFHNSLKTGNKKKGKYCYTFCVTFFKTENIFEYLVKRVFFPE